MKKIKKLLSIMLSLAIMFMIIPIAHTHADGNMSMDADDNAALVDEEKIYCKATIDDDFEDDKVIVVLKHSESMEFKDYSVSDFPQVQATAVNNLTYETGQMVKSKVQKSDIVMRDGTTYKCDNEINVDTYNQIITIELAETGKEKVLEAVKQLEQLDSIKYVGPSYIYKMASANIPTNTPSEYNSDSVDSYLKTYMNNTYSLIDLPEAWYIGTGTDSDTRAVTVGVIDTGINGNHPDLFNNIDWSLSKSFLVDVNHNPLEDPSGHGTFVAGIIGAQGDNGIGIAGMSWDSKLVSLKAASRMANSDDYGISTYVAVSVINYANTYGIDILNFSYASSDGQDPNSDAVAFAEAIEDYYGLFVCSASNESRNNDNYSYYPGNLWLPNLITVGASTSGDYKSVFSNYGATTVDLFAPGEYIYSCSINGNYASDSGTSFAAPFVTGVAALVWYTNSSLNASEVKDAIMHGVDQVTDLSDICVSGGRLNAHKALLNVVPNDTYYNPAGLHVCSITHTYEDSDTHIVECSSCNFEYVEQHTISSSGTCEKCTTPPHTCSSFSYTSINRTTHRATCRGCGATHTETHSMQQSGINLICTKCGYTMAFMMKTDDEELLQ